MNSFQEVAISIWSWTILTMCTLTLFISMNCLDMIQLPTKMTNANRTLQTFVDMPIVNGVNCSLKLHWLQVFQKVKHWFCFLKSKVSVSSIFLHYIPLDQLIPIIRVECQNVLSNKIKFLFLSQTSFMNKYLTWEYLWRQ